MTPAASQPTLGAALAAAQAEFPPIGRSRTVKVKTKTGGSYEFSYAPLDAIFGEVRPALAKHGLAVSQMLTEHEGRPALETLLLHSSGERLAAKFPLPNVPASPQELGSLLTYLRRYALVALLGIATEEDDDGNHASGNTASAGADGAPAGQATAPRARPSPGGASEPTAGAAPPSFEPPAGATGRDPDLITTGPGSQMAKLMATWNETGMPVDVLKRLVWETCGVRSRSLIPKSKFKDLLHAVEVEKARLAATAAGEDFPF